MDTCLEIREVVSGYGYGTVLRGTTLNVPRHEMTCLIGPNGAGKSTLLRAISGLIAVQSGEIRLDGVALQGLTPRQILEAGVVHVPQDRSLFPTLTVWENLLMGGYILRDNGEVRRRALVLEERFPDHQAVSSLARRVAVRRAAADHRIRPCVDARTQSGARRRTVLGSRPEESVAGLRDPDRNEQGRHHGLAGRTERALRAPSVRPCGGARARYRTYRGSRCQPPGKSRGRPAVSRSLGCSAPHGCRMPSTFGLSP